MKPSLLNLRYSLRSNLEKIQIRMEEYARKHGDHDIVRLGLFVDMPVLSWGRAPTGKKKPDKTKRNPPLYVSYPKTKCGNQDGYFEDEFKRIFEGEFRKTKGKPKPGLKVPFIPAGPGKKHSTPNDYFGCFFDEAPERFSPAVRVAKKKKGAKPIGRNPMTNPVKLGGPGYVDICINPYPEHERDPYEPKPKKKKGEAKKKYAPFYSGFSLMHYFQENPYTDEKDDPPKAAWYVNREKEPKKPKGPRAPFIPVGPPKWMGYTPDGAFETYPEHLREPYLNPWQVEKFVKGKKKPKPKKMAPWVPTFNQQKTMQIHPTLLNVDFMMNSDNYKQYVPQFVKYL